MLYKHETVEVHYCVVTMQRKFKSSTAVLTSNGYITFRSVDFHQLYNTNLLTLNDMPTLI